MGVEEQLPPPLRGLPWLAGALAAAALLQTVDPGPTPVDAGAVTGSIELGGSGVAAASTSGAGSLDLGGSAGPAASTAGAGSLSLGGSGAAQAVAASAGSLSLGGSGDASAEPAGAGSLDLGGAGTASGSVDGAGSILLGGTGSWTAVALGSLDLGGTGSGSAEPVAAGSLTLAGSGAGSGSSAGAGSLTLGGTGTGTSVTSASATGSLTLGGTVAPTARTTGTGSITLGGSATGVKLGVLKVWDGAAWRNIGCGGIPGDVGRLKLWDGTQWVREACDSENSFTDDFNRADSGTLGAPWTTPVWATPLGISSGHAIGTSLSPSTPESVGLYDAATTSPDITVTVYRTAGSGGPSSNASSRIYFRNNASGSFFTLFLTGAANEAEVQQNWPGFGGLLVATSSASFSAWHSTPTVWRVRCASDGIHVYKDGVQVRYYASLLDAVGISQTLVGLEVYDANGTPSYDPYFDDFSVVDVNAPPARPLYVWTGTAWDRVACLVPA